MDIATMLYSLLSAGAGLMASAAASEFAKGAGKAALDALKDRLTGAHQVKSLPLLEDARPNPPSPRRSSPTSPSPPSPRTPTS